MVKLYAFFAAFRQGSQLANAAAWKQGQISLAALASFLGSLVALASAFGYSVPVSADQLASIAGGVLAVVGVANGVLTVTTSDKVGLPAKPDSETAPDSGGHDFHY